MLPWHIQVLIIASILGSYRIRGLQYVFSVAWTFIAVNHIFPWTLRISQIIVIWCAFLLVVLLEKKSKKRNAFKRLADQYQSPISKTGLQKLFDEENRIETINGKDHLSTLHQSLKNARKSVCILSGWINSSVFKQEFLSLLSSTLERGVDIYIGYWHDYQTSAQMDSDIKIVLDEINKIKKVSLKNKFSGDLFVSEYSDLEVILVKDQDYVIYGRNHWLASKKHQMSEPSYKLVSSDQATQEHERVVELLKNYAQKVSKRNTN